MANFRIERERLAEAFWPGPLTLVVPRREDCPVSLLASAGLPSLALRVPAHPVAQALLRRRLARSWRRAPIRPAASARPRRLMSGQGSATRSISSSMAALRRSGLNRPSSAFWRASRELLRPGGLAREEIESVLGRKLGSGGDAMKPVAPGQLESHYAPRAALRLDAEGAQSPARSISAFGAAPEAASISRPPAISSEAAANLFRMLHELDETGVEAIAVAPIPASGTGRSDQRPSQARCRPAELNDDRQALSRNLAHLAAVVGDRYAITDPGRDDRLYDRMARDLDRHVATGAAPGIDRGSLAHPRHCR